MIKAENSPEIPKISPKNPQKIPMCWMRSSTDRGYLGYTPLHTSHIYQASYSLFTQFYYSKYIMSFPISSVKVNKSVQVCENRKTQNV